MNRVARIKLCDRTASPCAICRIHRNNLARQLAVWHRWRAKCSLDWIRGENLLLQQSRDIVPVAGLCELRGGFAAAIGQSGVGALFN